jgi:integrase
MEGRAAPRKAAGLTAAKVRTARPGRYGDGNGLYLFVRSAEARFWVFRYTRARRMREMGLGRAGTDAAAVTLAEARTKAAELHKLVRAGVDPLAQREAVAAAAAAEAQNAVIRGTTFRTVAERYLEAHAAAWRNPKHRMQWRNTLDTYVHPHMGDLPVGEVGTEHVLAALEPIWRTKPETASRVRGRTESVLDYATARGWRSGENPARWRGQRLPHGAAGAGGHRAARALEFAILTAARSSEVLGARWGEVDMLAKVRTVPAVRMKAGREHRVPLSGPALDVLGDMARLRVVESPDAFVFPGGYPGRPLSIMSMTMALRRMGRGDLTVHGFRSTFRDWVGETTGTPREVAEAALAHVLGSKTEVADARGDMFDKRRGLMDEWAGFCGRPSANSADVIPFRAELIGTT